jgi:hypothetical protein
MVVVHQDGMTLVADRPHAMDELRAAARVDGAAR